MNYPPRPSIVSYIVIVVVVVVLLIFFWPALMRFRNWMGGDGGASSSTGSNATVIVVTQAPQQNPTQPQVTQPPQTNTGSGGLAIVATEGQACPRKDFSLEQGKATCVYAGGTALICEGDINFPTFNFSHDSDPNTGQVFIIDQTGTIDGTDNGGTCHYSPPWQLSQSISSVKHGCGGTCATVNVYKDGQLVQSA